jgi:hypothetical protein
MSGNGVRADFRQLFPVQNMDRTRVRSQTYGIYDDKELFPGEDIQE